MPAPGGMHAAALAEELAAGLASASPRSPAQTGPKLPPLLRVLVRLNAGLFLWTGVLRLLNTVVQFLPALYLSSLLTAVEQAQVAEGVRMALALFAVLCAKTFVENQFFYHTTNIGIRVRATLQAAIYRKSLRLPESAAAVPPVTLMQVDTGKVEDLAYSAHTLWDGVLQVLGYSALLVHYLGLAGLAGLALLLVCLPVNAWLSALLSTQNKLALQASEARVTRTSEVLNGIRAIRQMGWEDVFAKAVGRLREAELAAQRRRDVIGAYLISYFSALPPFMIAVVLFAYVLWPGGTAGVAFSPATVFTALSLLNQIRFPLLFYPGALSALAEGKAAADRISAYLVLEDAPISRHAAEGAVEVAGGALQRALPALQVSQGRYALSRRSNRALVVPHDLAILPGELVAVVGAVGSGKTTLVRALLAELPGAVGRPPRGSVAYCAQQPWIPGGTLREVICAGAPHDALAFQRACAAALVDFADPDDEVSTGTLSGGQQARVALARALYHMGVTGADGTSAVACVLDDVTAALDPQVASQVVDRCVFGALRRATRVLVTSDTGPLLRRCDRVVVMEANGDELRVRAVGSHAALVRQGVLQEALLRTEAARAGGAAGAGEAKAAAAEERQGGQNAAASAVTPANRITVAEERAQGAVPLDLYRRYFAFAKSPLLLGVVTASILLTNVTMTAQQWFIGLWTADRALHRSLAYYMLGVVSLGLVASALTFVRTMLMATYARRSSRTIHGELCQSVLLQATTRYFDANPTGRILQRFSKDLEQVDSGLPGNLRSASTCIISLVSTMATIALVSPQFVLLLGPLTWLYIGALQYYRPVGRELKRLEPLSRSPIYAEQAAAAAGVATIRQMRMGRAMLARSLGAIDGNTAVSFAAKAVDRWFSFRMELLGNTVVLAAALLGLVPAALGAAPAAQSAQAASRTAIAVTQSLAITGLLNWTVRTIAQTETSFGSFQRVAFTIDETEKEGPRALASDVALSPAWPVRGAISFRDVSLRYRDDLPFVLRGVSLEVSPGQRVGIVGRTGSGKSTLLRVLLRTAELGPGDGAVLVDGVDLRSVGLARLRAALTVIPQDNFLVTGRVRDNVDPRGEHTDDEVAQALAAASLGHWSLDRHVVAAGGGISPGERQLLGVARAVLRRSRVVALDEVTSRVDEATDRKVQAALRKLPAGTTLLVVSHRLLTLEDYDAVVVMEAGRVAEVGDPRALLARPGSLFARLWAAEAAGALDPEAVPSGAPLVEA